MNIGKYKLLYFKKLTEPQYIILKHKLQEICDN